METSQRPYAVIMALLTLCAVSFVLVVHFATRAAPDRIDVELDDAGRTALVDRMAAAGKGLYDSHPDADVGRLLLPNLEGRAAYTMTVATNRFGLRERDYALPKQDGITRIVLLGDSYVFGMNVAAEERAGVFLERFLRERSGIPDTQTVEVLHVGVPSWNIVNECAYVRRQLGVLRPDLVIHVSVQNDLDDGTGIRGFGTIGRTVPRQPRRAGTVISSYYPQVAFHTRDAYGQLARGIDWEGRQRFREAGDSIAELAKLLERQGARYLHVFLWGSFNKAAEHFLAPRLEPNQVAWLSGAFFNDLSYRISRRDVHWNRAGHGRVAKALYGWIVERDLLPALHLSSWETARQVAQTMTVESRRELSAHKDFAAWQDLPFFVSAIDFDEPMPEALSSLHGGVRPGGLVGAYASMFLRCDGASRLRLEGECLDRPELDGVLVKVRLDEKTVASISLQQGDTISVDVPIPEQLRGRGFLDLRLEGDDYLYWGDRLRECVTLRLHRVALVP